MKKENTLGMFRVPEGVPAFILVRCASALHGPWSNPSNRFNPSDRFIVRR